MSRTMVPMNIVSALIKAEDLLGKNRTWQPTNEEQRAFLSSCFSKREMLKALSPKELRSWIDTNAERLNKVLADEGFNIKLGEIPEGGFGVVSILDLLVEWVAKGQKSTIYTESKNYPGVRFDEQFVRVDSKRVPIFEAFTSEATPEGIALLNTKSGDKVWMTVAEKEASGFELIAAIEGIRKSELVNARYDELSFPMIDLDQETNISWLTGMETQGSDKRPYAVAQALQQTKFKMNELGAHLKDAVAATITITSIRTTTSLDINKPFYLWIEREGMDVPILYAYFDEQNWINPKNLKL